VSEYKGKAWTQGCKFKSIQGEGEKLQKALKRSEHVYLILSSGVYIPNSPDISSKEGFT
jgi:hypothetical protein